MAVAVKKKAGRKLVPELKAIPLEHMIEHRRGPRHWGSQLTVVAQRIGEWHRLSIYDSSGAAWSASLRLQRGESDTCRPAHERWEFLAQRMDDGRYGLYARRVK